jgi:hypothetical protein
MKPFSLRVQLGLVALGYVGVLVYSADMVFQRYLQEVSDPISDAASSGMYAFADWLMTIFIFFLFMIPSAFLLWVIRTFEGTYTKYSKVLLALSITAPVCLGLLCLGDLLHGKALLSDRSSLHEVLIERVFCAPYILVLMGASRLFARFDGPKRLVRRALLIEGGTFRHPGRVNSC